MENSHERLTEEKTPDSELRITKNPLFSSKFSLPWFHLRVFYVRISSFSVDNSTPECLTLNHIRLTPDTILEVNGVRCSNNCKGISSVLRRDRVDKKSEEATFVCTDSIRLAGSVKFEVFDKDDMVLYGVVEMSSSNGLNGESRSSKKWKMNCVSVMSTTSGFLKGKQITGSESFSPTIDVYVAGCCLDKPIILTKTLQLGLRKKHKRKVTLDSIPEYETTESQKDTPPGLDLQVTEYRNYRPESEEDYNMMYWGRTGYMEGEDGELSWFNAGVRVGVGIGLGVCLGVGLGVGLLVRTYQSTTRNLRSRFP
ncbi:hypothetical protein Vadar_031431 [Vaccinium darrowii]|uniref:Uncharacterized protein n=1 Tax=Vaccinium darrowii TaxID=229202 RepID=A0ACB7YAQ1_9ERIC|nr:hypothetical protein Vadar_031431 [Vaccinium darrowii]